MLLEPARTKYRSCRGLAAFLLERIAPEAVLGMFPADHVVSDEEASSARRCGAASSWPRRTAISWCWASVPRALRRATATSRSAAGGAGRSIACGALRRSPTRPRRGICRGGNFLWNSGIFLWKASTLADAIREHLSETAPFLEQIAAAYGTPEFDAVFAELYPKCENISLDYAVLEPRSTKGEHHSNIYCLPADFGWNDLGSWAALYDHQRGDSSQTNVLEVERHIYAAQPTATMYMRRAASWRWSA
jgi:mannose-1-phosphate guanylyltransferase